MIVEFIGTLSRIRKLLFALALATSLCSQVCASVEVVQSGPGEKIGCHGS